MRFEELIIEESGEELRLPLHPRLTVLAGLGPDERAAMAGTVLDALAGGSAPLGLRYVDATGRAVVVQSRGGRVTARDEDGNPVPEPIGSIATSRRALQELMVVTAGDVSPERTRVRDDEPAELREARDALEALAAQLEAAEAEQARTAEQRAELARLDGEIQAARDGAARRQYAQVLAQLERIRSEAAALESDEAAVAADQRLLAAADALRALASDHATAEAEVASLRAQIEGTRLDADEREALAPIPAEPPADLEDLVDAVQTAASRARELEHRLQDLAVATLPAPSDPIVAELGVRDQDELWATAERLRAAKAAMHEVRVSLGGLEMDDVGAEPTVVAEIEAAHAAVDEAERAADAVRFPAQAAIVVGALAGILGMALGTLLASLGLLAAIVAAVAGIVVPDLRLRRARRIEAAALEKAGATSYLGFHIRRVEATVDPSLRQAATAAVEEQRAATEAWLDLVGPALSVEHALHLEDEVRAYHAALQDLGETAEAMDQLRQELATSAQPALAAARAALATACEPYGVAGDDLERGDLVAHVAERCRLGAAARAQERLHRAEVVAQRTAERLLAGLAEHGIDEGDLPARLGALEWAVTRASEREDARRLARPRAEIDADLERLTALAAQLRRPEWGTVDLEEAAGPDVEELEAERDRLAAELGSAPTLIDLDRLRDRHDALARRVATLESQVGLDDSPGAIADLQQVLLARLTTAGQAGPSGDPVPVVLDEVLARVPPDRTWDLLDLVLRLSERHQILYLTGDAFVAAWARQRAVDGSITLLEADSDAEADAVQPA